MASKEPKPKDQGTTMEVPQVVIAQAEAAARQDQTEDGGPLAPTATK